MSENGGMVMEYLQSHPSRVRGLKCYKMEIPLLMLHVAPFTGAWIEIIFGNSSTVIMERRTLHGCVD